MSMNSSPSSNSSVPTIYQACSVSVGVRVTNTMYSLFSTFLLLPLCLLILYMGFHRWRHQRSVKMSHTDFFTYVMVVMELICVLSSDIYLFSIYIKSEITFMLGMLLYGFTLPAQSLFHVLTCVERYVAVVHPVTYMHLRDPQGVRIRNLSTICVWLLSFGWIGVTITYLPGFPTAAFFSLLGICIFLVCFFCLSVLCVLTRSGPGRADKDHVDPSKQRAFHMIVAITGALLLRSIGLMFCLGLSGVPATDLEQWCALMDSGMWMTVPSTLVLPLLFLLRAGKLSCWEKKVES